MRVKQLWEYVPLPSKLKLLWDRITFSRLTTFYFIFSVLHCIIQVVFQTQAFFINQHAATLLYSIMSEGGATAPGFPVLGNDLRQCTSVPNTVSAASCQVVWSPQAAAAASASAAQWYASNQTTAFADNAHVSSSTTSQAASSTVAATTTSAATSSSSVSASAVSSSTASRSVASSPSAVASPVKTASATSSVAVTKVAALSITSSSKTSASSAATSSVTANLGDDDEEEEEEVESDDADGDQAQHKVTLIIAHNHKRDSTVGDVTIEHKGSGNQTQVTVNGVSRNGKPLVLDHVCLEALNWPVSVLLNTKREDITFIAFQWWVLGMSTVALLNESIPHIIASLLTHLLATAWAAFQITNTASFHSEFARLTTNGACKGNNLLPDYWIARGNAEIPSLALNAAALLLSAFLTWRLIKAFGWQTFKRVGASLTINRVYKVVLTLSITIQLSLFFMVATLAIWLDQLWNGSIAIYAERSELYKVFSAIVLALLLPWLMTGWFAVRREARTLMMIFLGLCIVYMAGWAAMFAATTFRWTFVQWRFFSVIASASVALTIAAFGLGLVCRINFGKGLPRYLNAQEPLPGDDFVPALPYGNDLEKVDFPSNEKPVPTYSAAFGSGDEVPPPGQMFAGRQMGPRFYSANAEPFESEADVTAPQRAHTRSPSEVSREAPLVRKTSRASERSFDSTTSSSLGHSKRWVIE
ncbi:hypothetical protein PLICRDRAFT_35861 [Plicaturopsis crispa FD-325 SS-3]|nr:hypothetical protein PLICRDRAFT_35861 [Plicaturopsis crispa FD-325 SS-3]